MAIGPTIDPAEVGTTGLLWLFLSYGYALYYAADLIGEGSELLLLVPSMAGLVGGVVLPLLGAVPDGGTYHYLVVNLELATATVPPASRDIDPFVCTLPLNLNLFIYIRVYICVQLLFFVRVLETSKWLKRVLA
jgi:hypothetical protein